MVSILKYAVRTLCWFVYNGGSLVILHLNQQMRSDCTLGYGVNDIHGAPHVAEDRALSRARIRMQRTREDASTDSSYTTNVVTDEPQEPMNSATLPPPWESPRD